MLRASLKGLFSRKLRLTLAVVAIVLGVSFLSGAFVLTDSLGARFEKLFQSVNENVSVQVQLTEDAQDEVPQPRLTQEQLDRIAAVPGSDAVQGQIEHEGVIPFDATDGKPVTTSGAPQIGVGITGQDTELSLISVAEGRWPQAADEIVLSRYTAEQTHATVGGRLKVYLPEVNESREFTVVGVVVYTGDRSSLAGETLIGFQQAEAQTIFYGATGRYSGVQLSAAPSVSDEQLRDRVAAVVPTGFEAKTGKQINDEQANDVQDGLSQLSTYFFGPFAVIAVLVGIFLIFNTFNIVVAQRARELALFRAMGASWWQVTGSVLAEAVLVGIVGATLGLAAGVALGMAGSAALTSLLDVSLPGAGLVVGTLPIVLAYVVGIGVTIVAAFVPAVKASAVPPLAAMREISRPDRPLRTLSIVGAAFALPGAALTGAGLTGLGGLTLPALLLGLGLVFFGVALLSPLLTRPVAGLIGKALGWGTSGRLGVRNALRNPRRTAVTAAALMIGVTLVSAAGVVGESFKKTITDEVSSTLGADVIITTDFNGQPDGRTGFSDEAMDKVRKLPGVARTSSAYITSEAKVDGKKDQFLGVFAVDDLTVARQMLAIEVVDGSVDTLGDHEIAVDENTAKSRGWKVGDSVPIELVKGGVQQYRLVGIFASTPVMSNNLILPRSAVADFAGPLAGQAYIDLTDDADAAAVTDQIKQIMADYPMVKVGDRTSLIEQFTSAIDVALAIVSVLLGVAIIIALLGILNTLLLSIYERTRELGMLRAIGLGRRGVTHMIGTESVVMAVFGCLLGIAIGVGLGSAISAALIDRDFLSTIAIPWGNLIAFVVAAVFAGVLASLWPAWRAARLNVLAAIAYE